jgi:predicted RND superfamily exporter protein
MYGFYRWIGNHIGVVVAGVLMVAMGLGVVGPMVANTDEPNFDPKGELYTTYEDAGLTLRSTSSVSAASWVVEADPRGANVLTADSLGEWKALTEKAKADPAFAEHLVDRFDPASGTTVPGISSIADVVDAAIPGGLGSATDAEVNEALTTVLADGSPYTGFRHSLSEDATVVGGVWTAEAFMTQVVYDTSGFDDTAAEEAWLKNLQGGLREGASATTSIGVAIDPDTAFGEAAEQSAPFIFLAVALIILLIAFVHRSYWSAVVVGAGLAAATLASYGTSALLGLKMGSLLLAFIVPIAMISFGVDFYIHGLGRVREAQVDHGKGVDTAYPFGMSAVFTAMLLALMSSVAAFLANAASGTEAIIQFGIGSAIALGWAYLVLGQVAPRVTVGLERFVGTDPVKGASRYVYGLGALVMAVVGGLAVALGAVMPSIGTAALVVFLALFIVVPIPLARLRNRRAAAAGRPLVEGHTGSAHGLATAGTVVRFLAKWRMITIPVVVVLGVLGFMRASNIESGFNIEDFLSSDTEFAQSIDRVATHFPSSGEGSSFVLIEGDLLDPGNLGRIDGVVDDLRASDAAFGTNGAGEMTVALHAGDVVRMVMDSPAVAQIEATGPSLVDADGNGIPDTRAGVAAVVRHATAHGVMTPEGDLAISPEELTSILADTGNSQATAVVIQVGSFTDGEVILPVEHALDDAAARYVADTSGMSARVSGDVLTSFHSMEAFTRSMLVSLPLALLMALAIAAFMLRSLKYALVSVLPIGLVVIGIYAFMATFGYTVNVVTATIAAIAVGVGIDFSTHFTARFREEMTVTEDRLEAVRVAGVGTGGALVLSALTSVLGFLVMALAPTPIFATFGTLTAVMIVLSLMVAILVLPSMLVLVTGSRMSVEIVTELQPAESMAG